VNDLPNVCNPYNARDEHPNDWYIRLGYARELTLWALIGGLIVGFLLGLVFSKMT
jgi:hypothetical protein